MTKYTALAVTTNYWKPHSNYTDKIIKAIEGKVEAGDFVVVSEKAGGGGISLQGARHGGKLLCE